MELYSLPYKDGFLIYRPLLRLAFLGNAAMVNLLARLPVDAATHAEQEALEFLSAAGYFEPDPEPPPLPEPDAPYLPTVAVLCLTTACNLRCVYCYARGGETPLRQLPVELGRRAIDTVCRNARDAGDNRFRVEFHGGGEPTLARDLLVALVDHARRQPLAAQVSVTTNGYWAKGDRDWLLANVDQVNLSLDGLEEIQNRQRPNAAGGPTFARVLSNVQAMDRAGVSYGIRLTVTDESVESLVAGIAMLTEETACRLFQVEPAFACGRAQPFSMNQRFAEAFLEAREIGVERGRQVYYSGARPGVVTRRFCGAIDKALVVTADGFLTGCYEVCGQDHPLAGRFFIGTMRGEGIRIDTAARLAFQAATRQPPDCAGCFCYWHCAGDCPSKAHGRCELNRTITMELLVRNVAVGGGLWREVVS